MDRKGRIAGVVESEVVEDVVVYTNITEVVRDLIKPDFSCRRGLRC